MTRLVMVVALMSVTLSVGADASGLDALLKQVREGQADAAKLNREREQRFLRNKSEQAALQSKAEAELATAKAQADQARRGYDVTQREIAALRTQLQERAGDYTQVNAAVRQLAGDFRAVAADSLVTAQVPERMAFLDEMASSSDLPSVTDLETLWFRLQEEMTEGGKVARFSTEIVDEQGVRKKADVVRVGEFTAIADGRYLVPGSEGTLLTAVPRQPGGSLQRIARNFVDADADEKVAPVLIDPSRGSLLTIEGEKPDLFERIRQGGVVGYVIIVIGLSGVALALGQMLYLERVGRRMRAQLSAVNTPSHDNPLGRVLGVFRDDHSAQDDDPELLELRLSEAVLREMPALERAQSILRLFAAAAPLLGLLGTVTGMIVTFQTITIFGTGDPKLMADGISQALVTTVLGLVAAIPLLFINALLATRARGLVQILDEQSAGLLAQRLEAARA
ncbi:MotA/TolQ/ExbB proton channel family protein [Sinimarinibacterium sp. CAU 1509]|uniref:MotA/TolQ/ExbB proton channel family protein n=1 Tax=Sinimarinibacterium sp. CAU 1509 TaxID=2562283 RepID=UPI00200A7192|nr:MotA/TolQ/ExbB proton channel family protein [Sinimarinibacterium sp. CAU 1509]